MPHTHLILLSNCSVCVCVYKIPAVNVYEISKDIY